MIQQVVSENNAYTSSFKDFKQPQNGYYLNTPSIENSKDKKSHKLGVTLAASALLLGFGTLAILRGGANKGLAKLLSKWKLSLEKKLSNGTKFEDLYRFILNRTNDFLNKSESINNFTTLKDVLFQKFMFGKNGERKFTRKIHEGITAFFDKISRKTVTGYYNKAQTKFSNLTEYFSALNEKIRLQNPNDVRIQIKLDDISKRMAHINENLEKGFGTNARKTLVLDKDFTVFYPLFIIPFNAFTADSDRIFFATLFTTPFVLLTNVFIVFRAWLSSSLSVKTSSSMGFSVMSGVRKRSKCDRYSSFVEACRYS